MKHHAIKVLWRVVGLFVCALAGSATAASLPNIIILADDLGYLATFAADVGEPLPPSAPNAAGSDSSDFLPALLGTAKSPLRPQLLLQSSKGVYAIRQGPWKLIASGGIEGKDGKRRKTPEDPGHAQLFNLKDDPGEQHDVSAEHMELVQDLTKTLQGDRDGGYSRK